MAPVLNSPADGAGNVGRAVALNFSSVSGADGYQEQVLQNASQVLLVSGNSGIAVTLPSDGTYQWRVRATNFLGAGPWSTSWTFTTYPLLSPPALLSPADTAVNVPINASLIWSPPTGAASSQYEIYKSGSLIKQGTSAGGSAVVATLDAGASYSWRVRAATSTTMGPWSATRTFSTVASPSGLQVQFTPQTGAAAGTVRFNWPTSQGNTYWLQYKHLLADPEWNDLQQVPAGATQVSVDEFIGTNDMGFFRVAQRAAAGPLPTSVDSDQDGMSDAWELAHGLNPNDPSDALTDPDNDGLNNLDEFELGTSLSTQDIVGSILGTFAVNSAGAATYVIPIAVPPGTAGMAPKLAIAYSSRSPNGLLGIGWALSGLSAITRCSPTMLLDRRIGGINFDDDDRFCLDGQRLVSTGGTYGADGTEYRTEIDTFTKVVSYGRTGNGPTSFRAWSKGGQVIEYGLTDDSRVEAQGKTTAMVWLANKIIDTSGNYIRIYYCKNAATGEYNPAKIEYTGNDSAGVPPYAAVLFSYEARPDTTVAYQAGSAVNNKLRLHNIETYNEGSLVMRYSFAYEQGAATGRSRLSAITLSDANGRSLPPTQCLGWTDVAQNGRFSIRPPFQPAGYDLSDGNYRYMVGDYNGDGVADLVHFASPDGVRVWMSSRDGTFDIKNSFPANGYDVSANNYKLLAGDFNGDGKDDLVHIVNNSQLRVWLSRGDGTFNIRPAFSTNGYALSDNNYDFLTGDFDGDGRTDLMHIVSKTEVRVWLSNGDGTFRIMDAWNPGYDISYNNYKVFIVDANGDGRADVIHFANDSYIRIWFSNGDGTFRKSSRFPETDVYALSQNNYAFSTGDFNGDGKTDLIHFVDRDSVRVWLNRGDGTFDILRQFTTSADAVSDNNYNFQIGDFNGDGKTDLIHFSGADAVHVWTSQGNGTFKIEDAFPTNGYNVAANNYKFMVGNFSSDSKSDLIHLVNSSYARVWNSSGPLPDQLTLIVDGYNHTNRITYKPLTDPTVYTKGTGATYPQSEVQGPIYVVAAHAMGDGLGGEAQTTYTYGGARMDQNRGFLGFKWQRSVEERTGIQQYTEYRQEYPLIGSLSVSEARLADNRLISRSTNSYAVLSSLGGQVTYPRVASSSAETYELDGSLVSRICTSSQSDAYGNPTVVDVTSDDGYRKVTTSTYANDVNRWILGKVVRAQVTASAPGQSDQTRTSSFQYDLTTGLLTREVVEPGAPETQVTDYLQDTFGNTTQTTISGPGVAPRSSRVIYDPQDRFPVALINGLGHRETRLYDPFFGGMLENTSPNGLTMRWAYDGFGRKRREVHADGVTIRTLVATPDANAPANCRCRVITKASGAARSTSYMDELGRDVRIMGQGFDGRAVYRDVIYNPLGWVDRTSRAYFPSDPVYWTVNTYDPLGRPTTLTNPDGSSQRTEYHGLTTVHFNELNQRLTVVKNSQGWLLSGTDDAGNAVNHTYDAFGNLLRSTDPVGNAIINTYDIRSRKTSMLDPDAGYSQLHYNAFSEVVAHTDAKGQQFTSEYDVLGRMIWQTLPEGAITYSYDSAANGIGLLSSVASYNGYKRLHAYDSLSRLDSVTSIINGEAFTVRTHFDTLSRVDQIDYPTGYT